MIHLETVWLTSLPAQLSISCLLSVCMGACFATGVFTDSVESAAQPAGSLNAVWPSAIGLYFFLADVLMVPPAALLSGAADRGPTLRRTGYVSAFGFALFAAAAPAVRASAPWLVVLTVSTLSLPFALLSVLVMEHVLAWMPARFGLAVGMVSAASSVGTGVFATIFASSVRNLDVGSAILVSSLLLSTCTALLSIAIRLPQRGISYSGEGYGTSLLPSNGANSTDEDTDDHHCGTGDESASLTALMHSAPVWLYATAIGALCVAFPMMSSVFRIGKAFVDADSNGVGSYLLRVMQVSSAVSTGFNLVAPAASDVLRTRDGWLKSGAANVTFFALAVQTAAFLVLCISARSGNLHVWGAAAAVTQTTYQAALACAALLARDAFGARHMALVYGAAGGPALGVGDGLSAVVMAALEWVNGQRTGRRIVPTDYLPFYFFGALLSAAGAFAVGTLAFGARKLPVNITRSVAEEEHAS